MIKIAYIRQIGKGKWRVFSRKGKNLGTYSNRADAVKRLRQVEYFKHLKASVDRQNRLKMWKIIAG